MRAIPSFISLIALIGLLPIAFAEESPFPTPNPKEAKLLEQFKTNDNIVYKEINGESLDLILFLPDEKPKGTMPVMLYTHGGGWGGGNKYRILKPSFLDTLHILLDNGIACASIEYRLTRRGISTAIDSVADCKDAARFLILNADRYGLVTSRMGVWGGSAGGHLSLMTGLADNTLFPADPKLAKAEPRFRCIASYYPATSFLKPELSKGSNFEKPQRMVPLIGGLAKDNPEAIALISPTEHLKKTSPPTLLLHGDNDTVLPIAHSLYFMEIAKETGANAQLLTVEGGGHSFSGKEISPSMAEINRIAAEFIISNLQR